MNCPLCVGQSRFWFREQTVQGDFSIYRCAPCKFAFVAPIPKKCVLDEFYRHIFSHPIGQAERAVRKWEEFVASSPQLKSVLKKKRRILEVGAGTGSVVRHLKSQGHEVTAQEQGAFTRSIRRSGMSCVSTAFIQHHPNVPYDIIVLLDVIEHVSDPLAYLKHANSCLKQGGILVMTTPNFASRRSAWMGRWWPWISPPGHLYYFSPKSMERALRIAGFTRQWLASGKGDANSLLLDLCFAVRKLLFVPVKTVLFEILDRRRFMPRRTRQPSVACRDDRLHDARVHPSAGLCNPTLFVVARA